ncbi:MAG: DMT family transporter [Thermoplasmata archaeon]
MNFKSSSKIDILLFIVMSISWALNYPLLKIALFYEPPLATLFFRVLFGAIFSIPFSFNAMRLFRVVGVWKLLTMSLFNVTMFMAFWFIGERTESASISSIIIYTYPILSVLFSFAFLNETLSVYKVLSIAVGFLGIILIFLNQLYVGYNIGLFLLVASSLSWAIGTVFYKKYLHAADLGVVNSFQFFFALPVIFLISLAYGGFHPVTVPFILVTLYMGSIGSSLAYFIYWSLIRKYRVSHVSPYLFSVPAFSILFSFLITGERPGLVTLVGFLFVASGIFLSTR